MLFSFEDFSLDTARRELRRGGVLIALQPQVFDLLEYAIRNRERVVSKDDLLAAVWNGRIVSESTLSTRINAARSALSDSGEEQRLIRTTHGKGIRFVGAVREVEETIRKLAAIFAADVAGYSRLMGQDEVGTLRRLTACRAILDERIAAYRGRIFGSAGDSVVADFASAVDAVQCAVAVQEALAKEEQMRFRIGVHVGDVIVQGDNLFGDRRQHRCTTRSACRARRDLHFGHGVRSDRNQAAPRLHRSWRAAGQEHRPADPRLSCGR
jgi:DNA-binding winged helix-turn-helix (wHTH) protein